MSSDADTRSAASNVSSLAADATALANAYRQVRATSERLCQPLQPEDFGLQSMPDVSPARWHLAHVTWFFETFILKNTSEHYEPYDRRFEYLFNSYYNAVGAQFPRPQRGLLTRPTTEEVFAYRHWVDERMLTLIESDTLGDPLLRLAELGLHHEQQHQELMLMDLKHALFQNPLYPAYGPEPQSTRVHAERQTWSEFDEGLFEFGHAGGSFAFDNESPRHRHFLNAFALSDQLVSNADYLNFISDGGYRRPELWLADGWDRVKSGEFAAPLYWVQREGTWHEFTLGGLVPLDLGRPVSHISLYEADAFATWAEARLPNEHEWEFAAGRAQQDGHFADSGEFHPRAGRGEQHLEQMLGDVWEWTRTPYGPYPGFKPAAGAVGEYNGKFMCNQIVMRGGCCATPAGHARITYRNFFYPQMRWQFGGLRLARDL